MPPLPIRTLSILSVWEQYDLQLRQQSEEAKYHLSVRLQQKFADTCMQEGDSEQRSFAFNAFWFIAIS